MTTVSVEHILELLREDGGRVTESRRHIVEAIAGSDDHHLTAAGLIETLRHDDPDVHESTVYRTLDRLVALDILEPVQITPGATVFHVRERRHHHLLCDSCGRLIETDPDLLDGVADRIEADHGFAIRAAVTLHGRCRDCLADDATASSATAATATAEDQPPIARDSQQA